MPRVHPVRSIMLAKGHKLESRLAGIKPAAANILLDCPAVEVVKPHVKKTKNLRHILDPLRIF